jgi:hypothetical protein
MTKLNKLAEALCDRCQRPIIPLTSNLERALYEEAAQLAK